MSILRSLNTARRLYNVGGWHAVVNAFAAKVQNVRLNPLADYQFFDETPLGAPFDPATQPKTVNWLIPPFGLGSGGHLNIFRLVRNLEEQGFAQRIYIVGKGSEYRTAAAAREAIRTHFVPIDAEVHIGLDDLKSATITAATSWETAYSVRNIQSTKQKVYFVQDFEPYFFPPGSQYMFAEETYRFGFFGVTAGGWLAEKLQREYGMRTAAMGFSYDRHLYVRTARRDPDRRRVFFYARPPTPRRAFELGLLTLARLHRAMPEVEIVMAGWPLDGYEIDFPHISRGNMALADLPDFYSQCDAALILSSTNLSLTPLELMACGCVVVSNAGPNVEWLLGGHNAILASPTPADLSEALIKTLRDDDARRRLSAAAMTFAQGTDWRTESARVARTFESLARSEQ